MVISREDRVLIKVLRQEKGYGSKKLLAEFPIKAFELIPTMFIVLETYVFSVSSNCLCECYIMLCKCYWIVLYTVHVTAFSLGGGGIFFWIRCS